MADSEGCERNPFAEDVFRLMVAYLENMSEIEKIVCPCKFGPCRHDCTVNPPYSCKKQNGDRQKSIIGTAFQAVTDALTV